MNWTAENQPAVFFATCARLLPNDVRVAVEQGLFAGLSLDVKVGPRGDLKTVVAGLASLPRTPFV